MKLDQPRKILVAEDEPVVAELMRDVLQSIGHSVELASEGVTALNMARSRSYDFFIIDLILPGPVEGRRLYHELVGMRSSIKGRVLFVTGDIGSGETTRFPEEVGSPFLYKPFSVSELTDQVQRILMKG